MASWTSRLIEFSPYVQEVPVEDMTKVAMFKQDQYNAGVARVQSYLDTINGLPVATEADKMYLNSLSSKMENQVRGVVSADFSNLSLQSQIGSMAAKIAKDPVIQNSVMSATRIQQLKNSFAELRKAKPEKYSQMNEQWVEEKFLRGFYEQGKTETGLIYNGPTEAIPYTDYRKILGEELKKIEPSIQTTIDANGQFQYTVDKSSKILPSQIKALADSIISTNPDIQKQMEIDGYFAFKGHNNESLFNHINNSTRVQLDEYNRMDKEIREAMDSDPNNIELADRGQAQLKDIAQFKTELARKRNTYLEGINSGNIDLVKQTLFNDNLRDGLVLQFAKNNHDIDVKTNDALLQQHRLELDQSENWLKFVEAGVDPVTRQALDPSNPLYNVHLATKKSKASSKKSGEEDEEAVGQAIDVSGAVDESDSYNITKHLERIKGLESNIGVATENLKKQYANILGMDYDPTSKDLETKFRVFQAEQEKKFQNGEVVDPTYAKYRNITKVDRALKAQLEKFSQNAAVKVQQFIKANGDDKKPYYTTGLGDQGGIAGITGQFLDVAGNLIKGRFNRNSKVETFEKDLYKELGKTTSFQAKPISIKESNNGTIKSLVVQAIAEQAGDPSSDDVPSLKDVLPLTAYNNPDGSLSITYQKSDKDSEIKRVNIPASKNVYGNPNPYLPIEQLIDISGKTPMDPQNALASYNGRIKYAIIKDPQDGTYQLSLLRNGRWLTIPNTALSEAGSQAFTATNVGSIIQRVEQLSQLPPEQLDLSLQLQFSGK